MDSVSVKAPSPNEYQAASSLEDVYFLDRSDAMTIALEQNFVERDGVRRLQLCYFDGRDFDEAPINLIGVPIAEFSDRFGNCMLPLPSRIEPARDLGADESSEVKQAFAEMVDELQAFRDDNPRGDFRFGLDTYFFSARDAYREAIQQKQVDLKHPTVYGLQVCYYDGDEMADAPANMLHLPAEQVADRLLDARTRPPTAIHVPAGTPDDVHAQLLGVFDNLIRQTMLDRNKRFLERMRQARELAPSGTRDRFKVMLVTTRVTQVLQFETYDLARAFESLGHEVLVAIEPNAMEQLFEYELLMTYLDFAPDVFVIINHVRNRWLHPDVSHVIWFQDLMKPLVSGEQIHLRDNDQVYSATVELDSYLQTCGVDNVQRQSFCVDTSVFHPPASASRRRRIVFVGSAYAPKVSEGPRTREMAQELVPRIAEGEVFSRAEIEEMADRIGVEHEQAFWVLYHFLTRDQVVHWMCERLPAMGIEVEVYGRYWGDDPVVSPYFHGEIAHGHSLADLYRDSMFALVCHPFDLNSQRLGEVAACGCIPVVYDCRSVAEAPHWDEQCLFFKTAAELARLFEGALPTCDPAPIAERNSYRRFAETILQRRAQQMKGA